MRELVIARLTELATYWPNSALEDEAGEIFTPVDFPKMSNADLLALLEYTIGFQG